MYNLIWISFVAALCWQCKASKTNVKVTGTVTQTGIYCGGARPSQKMLDDLAQPKPLPHIKLFVRNGNTNKHQAIIKSVVTDANGYFEMYLKPGSYCMVDSIKMSEQLLPPTDSMGAYDIDCLKLMHEQCLYDLKVERSMEPIKINYQQYCAWNKPCLQQHILLPPGRK
jgi:hypothetical protein